MEGKQSIMTDINKFFFELIRVAIGNAVCLSHTPTAKEWQMLYEMAKKQSLVGVCFAGVQKLVAQQQSPSELQYLQWMGMAAKIQQRNEVLNRQCVVVQKILEDAGFKSAILKGQGVASLYRLQKQGDTSTARPDPSVDKNVVILANLRQSGDIDIWVEGGMEKVLDWCKEKYGDVEFDYINAHVPVFRDTEVEVHWRVQALTNLFLNRKLQEWFKGTNVQSSILGGKADLKFSGTSETVETSIVVPTAEFNAFYVLLHCYHHMFESGLGLRQLMDYYFVLLSLERELPSFDCAQDRLLDRKFDVNALLKEFGMEKFTKGVMWIMQYVFGMEQEYLLCDANEKEGRFLLKEVMQNGNFGHHDERIKKVGSGKMSELWRNVHHNWHLASHYPMEMIWQPIWLCYHFIWKRNLKLKLR